MGNKKKSFTENAAVVAFMTMISRVGGLVREILMANFFGAGVIKSAFDVAYRIPNLFRRLFGEGALSAALIPIYTEIKEKEGRERADKLASQVATLMLIGLGFVVLIAFLLTYPLAMRLGEDGKWGQIMPLLRIMLPYAPLICLAALIMGVLNSLKSFAISALAPAFQNFCWIAALAVVCPFIPDEGTLRIEVVSWSILLSGVIQVIVQFPELKRNAVPLRLTLGGFFSSGDVKRVFKLMLPMALAAGVVQINVCLDSILAMKAGEWGPSALGYADRLVYLPLAIVGASFATVLLPTLSTNVAREDYATFRETFERSMRSVFVIMSPAAFGMIALAGPIIYLIYETGAFDPVSTERTSNALIAYSTGLVWAGLYKIIVTAFYSRKDSRTPVVVGTIGVALNLSMNVFFIWILPVELKPVGIAIATSISSFLSSVVLLVILSKNDHALFTFKSQAKTFFATLAAGLIMGLCVYFAYNALSSLLEQHLPKKLSALLLISLMIILGTAIYFTVLSLMDRSALKELLSQKKIKRLFKK